MKTNKSFTKRLRLTKKGKIVSRAPGQNHFNAKKSGSERQKDRRAGSIALSVKDRARYLPQ